MAEPIEPPVTFSEVATPDESSTATEVFNSVKVSLADLCAKGTAQYAHKNYDEASDLFARASELQAELNGDMSPDNAEILFLYGRSLFKVGQSKSDVLGGKASGEKKKSSGSAKPKKTEESERQKITEAGVGIVAEQNGGAKTEDVDAKKPLFQFTGDENFEDSDDDDAEEAGDDEEEEEDDLAAAFEVLDLARVLFEKRLEAPEDGEGKGKETGDPPMTRHLKERIADTHDLLAEISLENERFPAAVSDSRASLLYKQQLYPEESEIIAEAHFKLSLALEFASTTNEKKEGDEEQNSTEDEVAAGQALRDEAVKELQAAINNDNEITRAQIVDVKEIVADMENRLAELKGGPVDVDGLKSALGMSGGNSMGGILGATIGESPSEAAARIEEAKKGANDLSSLVRKKDKKDTVEDDATEVMNTNGKRKAEDEPEEDSESSKKAKVEDAAE
ncbi:putative NASP-related protein sim3 [Glarea lozoyensis 74030]|uniref:Putative NASP-related protein sim3 n=1 Tax=Glarea lozoyensis (strain ATCC 74030 / MF5533) TaxID=1104152 RepID=H0EDD1_GLAL7|nr:putative NASP-related protein sim3 [Glarea lozoyensis 74030]